MRYSPRVMGILCAMWLGSCKQEDAEVAVHWVTSPLQIDGQFADWDAVAESRRHEDHAVLKLGSDSEALYIYYVTDDLNWVRTIRMTGLTIYLNRNGSHDKDFFICYRGGPPTEELMPHGEPGPGARPGPNDMHPALRDQLLESDRQNLTAFTCFVRDWIVEKSIPPDGRQGPQAAFGKQNGRFAYEFKIPLSASQALYYGLGAQPGTKLGIGAEWGGLPRPVLEAEPQPGSSDFGGTAGQGSGFGTFGGSVEGEPPPGAPAPHLPEKEAVWISTRLATPPERAP